MNIHKIKDAHQTANPKSTFFDRENLKHARQTLKDFKICKRFSPDKGEIFYKITAPRRDRDGQTTGETLRYFVPSFPSVLFHTPPVKTANGWEESNPNYPTQTEQNGTNI